METAILSDPLCAICQLRSARKSALKRETFDFNGSSKLISIFRTKFLYENINRLKIQVPTHSLLYA